MGQKITVITSIKSSKTQEEKRGGIFFEKLGHSNALMYIEEFRNPGACLG